MEKSIERSVHVRVPAHTAYQQWMHFEEFPRFMEGVREVRRLDDKHMHWVADIGGRHKEWDSEITEQIEDQRIAWRSVDGTYNAGAVDFNPIDADETEVRVRKEYEPEGVMENIGSFLNTADRRVAGDLERFKEFVESNAVGSSALETGALETGASARATSAKPDRGVRQGQRAVLPEAEEELEVGKREVERGRVRVHTETRTENVEETVHLRDQHAAIERHPTDRAVPPGEDVFQEREIELRETEEEPVVAKRTRVVGEVEVGTAESAHDETIREPLRHTEVKVDRLSPEDERHFRTLHERQFGKDVPYDEYSPAYGFGSSLRSSHESREWNELESDARRQWESRSPGTWERFKQAIRAGWQDMSGKRT